MSTVNTAPVNQNVPVTAQPTTTTVVGPNDQARYVGQRYNEYATRPVTTVQPTATRVVSPNDQARYVGQRYNEYVTRPVTTVQPATTTTTVVAPNDQARYVGQRYNEYVTRPVTTVQPTTTVVQPQPTTTTTTVVTPNDQARYAGERINNYSQVQSIIRNAGEKFNSVSQIRGEGPEKQANKLNLGLTSTVVETGPAPVQTNVLERKVYVDVDSVEEKNIIAEAYAKMALLIMENKRLRAKLSTRQAELRRL